MGMLKKRTKLTETFQSIQKQAVSSLRSINEYLGVTHSKANQTTITTTLNENFENRKENFRKISELNGIGPLVNATTIPFTEPNAAAVDKLNDNTSRSYLYTSSSSSGVLDDRLSELELNLIHEKLLYDNCRKQQLNLFDYLNATSGPMGLGMGGASQSPFMGSMVKITYKSKYFMLIAFVLLAMTLLPVQYHSENFSVQMKKMLDSCADSYGYFNENQTYILDTLFPFGFSQAISFDALLHELNIIDDIHRRQNLNNLTIKYLTHAECMIKNYTNILNLITIPSETTGNVDNQRQHQHHHHNHHSKYAINYQLSSASPLFVGKKKFEIRQQTYHQLPASNIILICDDESYKKSLFNRPSWATKQTPSSETAPPAESNQPTLDFLDFQTNVLTQVTVISILIYIYLYKTNTHLT